MGQELLRPQAHRHHRRLAGRHRHRGDAVLDAQRPQLPRRPAAELPEAYITFRPEAFGDDGEIRDESTEQFLTHYMDEYAAFVQRVLAANAPGHIGDPDAL